MKRFNIRTETKKDIRVPVLHKMVESAYPVRVPVFRKALHTHTGDDVQACHPQTVTMRTSMAKTKLILFPSSRQAIDIF